MGRPAVSTSSEEVHAHGQVPGGGRGITFV